MSKKIISFTLLSVSLLFSLTTLEAMRLRSLLKAPLLKTTPKLLKKPLLWPAKTSIFTGLLSHFPLKKSQNRYFSSKPLPNALLIQAVQSGSKEKLYELIKKGIVDINARYDYNNTILHIAARYNVSAEIAEILIKGVADVNSKNNSGNTPLHFAADYDRVEVVKLLIANGANPNALNKKGLSPLYFAQEQDKPSSKTLEIIKFLEPLTDKSLWFVVTPEIALRRAVLFNRLEEIIQLLSKHTFSKEVLDAALLKGASRRNMAETPHQSNTEILTLLIDTGADVNAKNFSKETPLHEAADWANLGAVKILLKRGANPNVLNRQGETPLDKAKTTCFRSDEIIKILEQHTEKREKISGEATSLSLSDAIQSNKLVNLQQVLAQRTFSKKELNVALIEAARGSNVVRAEMAAVLLDAGADIHTRGAWQMTPLHSAVGYVNPAVVQLLLSRDANPNARNDEGRSPLYLAQKGDLPSEETLTIIRLLEPVTNKSLWFEVTPEIMLLRAVKGGNTEQIRSLLEYEEEFEAEESARKKDLPNQRPTKKFTIGSQEELLKAWKQFSDKKTVYEILSLDEKSSKEEERAVYLNWVRNHHPDRYLDKELNGKATTVLKYLNGKLSR